MSNKILICGDSWGCGEIAVSLPHPIVTHPGLQQYLLDDGWEVENISIPGGSNRDTVEKVKKIENIDDFKYIIWFQTDPIRDLRPYNTLPQIFTSVDALLQTYTIMVNQTYEELNQLGRPILTIGGHGEIDPCIHSYSNLIPAILNTYEFLIPHKKTFSVVRESDWLHNFLKALGAKRLETRFEIADFLVKAYRSIHDITTDYKIFPDHSHPGRYSHKLIFDFLKEHYIK
jgi:hypothetical protein